MRNCVYRFLNKDNEVIYVGKAKNLKSRINNHNHLPKECYQERDHIEYIRFKSEADMNFAERYFIMKLNPKYNTILADKDFNINSFELDEKEWCLYTGKEEEIENVIAEANNNILLPREIWENDNEITMAQLAILSEITLLSLDTGYCYADKKELAIYFKVREQSITNMINKFKKKGYLSVEVRKIGRKDRKVLIPSEYLKGLFGNISLK